METQRSHPESIPYVVARIRQRLAEDGRTNLLDIQVKLAAGKLFLLGRVESEERRRAAAEVALEAAPPGTRLVNELWVGQYLPPPDTEILV